MEQNPPKPMTPFDSMITPPFLYTLKLLLPYIPSSMQRFLGIYIKYLELRHAMEYFQGFSSNSQPKDILDGLKPYMSPAEKEMMEQMSSMMNMMEMVQNMQAMSNTSDQEHQEINPLDLMKGMLNPEQQEMFDMYNAMFENELNTPDSGKKKGESDDE